jgi:hypothetical protein
MTDKRAWLGRAMEKSSLPQQPAAAENLWIMDADGSNQKQ